ncbi:MAG: NINE protein [Chitinophagales bacterium]
MKSKTVTSLLAFLFGSTGAHKFYLNQNQKGWYILLLFYIVFPGVIWYSKAYGVLNYYMLTTIWIVLILIIHFAECIRYAVMQPAKFEKEDASTGATIPLTVTSVLFGVAATYGFNYLMAKAGVIDIETAEVEYIVDAKKLSAELNADEDAYMHTYHGKVLSVTGIAISFGEDFEKGSYLALEAAPGSPADVNCFINAAYLNRMATIASGDTVTVTGVCNRRLLDNCKIVSVKKFVPAASADTTITL